MSRIEQLMRDGSSSGRVTWAIAAVLAVTAVRALLAGDLLWAAFDAAVVAVALVPPVLARDPSVVVSWRALLVAAVPVAARAVGVLVEPATYLSVAALGLLAAVEVDEFSAAEMPPWFAVTFVVLATLTVAGCWGIVQFAADVWLGTAFLTSHEDLMWDLVAATAVGIGAGVAFQAVLRGPDDSALTPNGEGP